MLRLALCGVLMLISSAFAHEGIDLVGNVLLPRDAYDGMPHEARLMLAIAGAIALACFAIGYVLRVADLHGGFDLIGAAREFRRHPHRTACAIVAGTLTLVPLLEWFDVSSVGGRIADLGDAYGGSVLLGAGVCVALALLISYAVFAAARWLCAHEWRIYRLIARVLRQSAPQSLRRSLLRAAHDTVHFDETPLARKRAMRAPPALLA